MKTEDWDSNINDSVLQIQELTSTVNVVSEQACEVNNVQPPKNQQKVVLVDYVLDKKKALAKNVGYTSNILSFSLGRASHQLTHLSYMALRCEGNVPFVDHWLSRRPVG